MGRPPERLTGVSGERRHGSDQRGTKLKADVAPPPGVKNPSVLDEVLAVIAFAVTVVVALPIALFVTPFRLVTGWFTRTAR